MSERLDVKQRVVVIDDDPGFRLLLSNMLEELEYDVYTIAKISPESLSVIKFTDIVFLDIRMPGLSGNDVIKLMAQDGVECSLVLMSGTPTAVTEAEELALVLGVELRCVGQAISDGRRDRHFAIDQTKAPPPFSSRPL